MMKRIGIGLLLAGFLAIFSLTSFQSDDLSTDEQALIDARIKEKVDEYIKRKTKRCRERILKRANEMADSLMIVMAKDSFGFYFQGRAQIPLKPNSPGIDFPDPSVDIAPLIDLDTFLIDSLLADSLGIPIDSLYQDSLLLDSLRQREIEIMIRDSTTKN